MLPLWSVARGARRGGRPPWNILYEKKLFNWKFSYNKHMKINYRSCMHWLYPQPLTGQNLLTTALLDKERLNWIILKVSAFWRFLWSPAAMGWNMKKWNKGQPDNWVHPAQAILIVVASHFDCAVAWAQPSEGSSWWTIRHRSSWRACKGRWRIRGGAIHDV